jgi:DNA-binding XRE family transcriptional regulator
MGATWVSLGSLWRWVVIVLLISRVLKGSLPHTLRWLQDIQRQVGLRIKALRSRRGMTQDQFAERAGLNRTHLYRIETGKQSITLRTMKIIADALEVRVRDLVRDV